MDYADWLLPATTWGEKDGTVTNSERRISRVRRCIPAPGEARDDWRIALDLARRLESRLGPRRVDGGSLFAFDSAEAVWNEHRESTRGRDLDITGLDYGRLDTPAQWPFPEGATQGRARLYEDGRFATEDGRARFVDCAPRPVAEARDARFPFSLTSGRLRDQWHGMSRTGTLGRLFAHAPGPAVELHPQELERRHWKDGDLVRVSSRRGTLVLPVRGTDGVAPAQAHIAMHWGPEWLRGGVNVLTSPALCPTSKQPELKHAAVRIEKVALPWSLLAAAWMPAATALETLSALRAHFDAFEFACAVPFGREPGDRVGVMLRAASLDPVDTPTLQAVELALRLDTDRPALRYVDARRGQRRAMRLDDEGRLQAFVLAGDDRAHGWVLELLQQGASAAAMGRALLASTPEPPSSAALAPRSPQVCACLDVSEARIVEAAPRCTGSPDERLAALQGALRCGTQCGSCVPALRSLLQAHPAASPADPAGPSMSTSTPAPTTTNGVPA